MKQHHVGDRILTPNQTPSTWEIASITPDNGFKLVVAFSVLKSGKRGKAKRYFYIRPDGSIV